MKQLRILHLYPDEMNTYGDRGNILTLQRRAEWHGLKPEIVHHHPGKPFPTDIDLVFGGGGQDSAQSDIQQDILDIADDLHKLVAAGTPMLLICGLYQLFGHKFITHTGEIIQGIGVFDVVTHATSERLIGNIAIETDDFGTLYGFENHSGQTYLAKGQSALGRVIRGNGNIKNGRYEGARTQNVIGCYMHGPLLPLNPTLSDWLITTAAQRNDPSFQPKQLDDKLAELARNGAISRPY